GQYPPPKGAPAYPGLECSGRVIAVGPEVRGWSAGDEAAALLAGGGYAQQVAVPAGQLMPIPRGLSLIQAAALPEVACTVYSNVFALGRLQGGETLLVHGGSSGIGTFAIQLARARGARVAVTAGSAEKLAVCRELGAEICINYREEDFVERLSQATGGKGVDAILDIIGAKYLISNVAALATSGRLLIIGLQGGRQGELDLGVLLAKRASVHATSLRARPAAEKSRIVADVVAAVWPLVSSGAVRPVIHELFEMPNAAAAHRLLEQGGHVGKLVLTNPDFH
ncbi:MAG: NAD(P)H-quinone oxidoreductase, partial [Mycobacteriales bacterium]